MSSIPDEAKAMTKAGADIVVAHMGVTTGGSIGATQRQIARRLRQGNRRHRRCGALRAQGRDPALPWRADLHARRCEIHSRPLHGPARLLWRVEHGAAAGGSRDPRPDGELQAAGGRRQKTSEEIEIGRTDNERGKEFPLPEGRQHLRFRLGPAGADGGARDQWRHALFGRRRRSAARARAIPGTIIRARRRSSS